MPFSDPKKKLEYQRRWWRNNREKHYEWVRRWKKRENIWRQTLLRRLKRRPCADCGGTFHIAAMQFDHVRGEKLFNIADSGPGKRCYSRKLLFSELRKCEIVCSNCHAIRTFQRGSAVRLARQAHNPKVAGSNPAPASKTRPHVAGANPATATIYRKSSPHYRLDLKSRACGEPET
jgi:hypothetical protein